MRYKFKLSQNHTDVDYLNEDITQIDIATSEPLKLECEHFLHCLKTRTKPISDGWNGVAVVEILEQAQQALENSLL